MGLLLLLALTSCRSSSTLQSLDVQERYDRSRTSVLDSLVRHLTADFDTLTLIIESGIPSVSTTRIKDPSVEKGSTASADASPCSPSTAGLPVSDVSRLILKASHARIATTTVRSTSAAVDSASLSSAVRVLSSVESTQPPASPKRSPSRAFLRGALFGAITLALLLLCYHYRQPLLRFAKKVLSKITH